MTEPIADRLTTCPECFIVLQKAVDVQLGHCGPCRHIAENEKVAMEINDGPLDRKQRNRGKNGLVPIRIFRHLEVPEELEWRQWLSPANYEKPIKPTQFVSQTRKRSRSLKFPLDLIPMRAIIEGGHI